MSSRRGPPLRQTAFVEFGNQDTCAPPCPPEEISLIAGQHDDAGIVTVSNDEENLAVHVETTDGWRLGETHLYVGPTPPTKSAPGRLPYANGADCTIPLTDLSVACGEPLYIAFHAIVYKDGMPETAWGEGSEFGHGWAMFFPCALYCEALPDMG